MSRGMLPPYARVGGAYCGPYTHILLMLRKTSYSFHNASRPQILGPFASLVNPDNGPPTLRGFAMIALLIDT